MNTKLNFRENYHFICVRVCVCVCFSLFPLFLWNFFSYYVERTILWNNLILVPHPPPFYIVILLTHELIVSILPFKLPKVGISLLFYLSSVKIRHHMTYNGSEKSFSILKIELYESISKLYSIYTNNCEFIYSRNVKYIYSHIWWTFN